MRFRACPALKESASGPPSTLRPRSRHQSSQVPQQWKTMTTVSAGNHNHRVHVSFRKQWYAPTSLFDRLPQFFWVCGQERRPASFFKIPRSMRSSSAKSRCRRPFPVPTRLHAAHAGSFHPPAWKRFLRENGAAGSCQPTVPFFPC